MLRSDTTRGLWPLMLTLAFATACDDPPPPGTDAGPEVCEPPTALEQGGEGHADPLNAPAGEVRAGRLTSEQLPEDPTGLATWTGGDFVLANDSFALLIEAEGPSQLYDPYGGRPVGIAAVEGGALVRAGDYNELVFGLSTSLVVTERVTVLADGSDGNAAIVRASGPLGPLDFAGELLESLVPGGASDLYGLDAALDYEMQPGSNAISMTLHVRHVETSSLRVPFILAGSFQRNRMPIWTAELGMETPMGSSEVAVFVDDDATSYAFLPPEGQNLSLLLEQAGVLVYSLGPSRVDGCATTDVDLGTIVLGGDGLAGAQASLAQHRGVATETVTGTVRESTGETASDVRLHVRHADGRHFARLNPAADGTYSIEVPSGESFTIEAFRRGTTIGAAVPLSGPTTDVELPPVGMIRVVVEDAAAPGVPFPARVQVLPTAGAPAQPSDMGERTVRAGRAHVVFSGPEEIVLRVDPGEHDVVISHGFEYELFSTETPLTVAAGETVTVMASLERVVDSTDVMCADYHIHTHRSPDSPDSPQLKLHGLIADGLEIPIRSDHEWINSFVPAIRDMGLSEYAYGMGGEELTTFAWGHFGVFPLDEDASLQNGGAISWVNRLPPAVFADVRARPERPVLIINHPRSGAGLGGYFNAAAFDPETGIAGSQDHWDEGFTLVEVFNDESFNDARDREVADWFGLLNSGRRVFAVGSSDSHNIMGTPVGYPRTCLDVGVDTTAELTDELVRDTTARGDSTISGGIYMEVAGPGDAGPGDEITGAGESVDIDVRLQAPSWINVTTLEVIVDGATVETITIGDPDPLTPTLRFDAPVTVPVAAEGSWVVFHASGDTDLMPVHPGRDAFAVSNPVFLSR